MLGRFLRVSLLVFLGLSRVPVSPYIHNNAISVRTMRQGIYISHAIYISGAGQGVVRLRFHAGVRPRVCVFRRRAYLLFPNVRRYVSLLLTFSPCPESRHFPSPPPPPPPRCLPRISKKRLSDYFAWVFVYVFYYTRSHLHLRSR